MIAKIFHDRGYGFIAANGDGHEVYFHRNSVIGERFEKLATGTKVRFAEEDGQGVNGRRRDTGRGSSPSGVHGRHRPRPRVAKQQRHAIGDLHGQDIARGGRDQRIRVRRCCVTWVSAAAHDANGPAMDLLDPLQRANVAADGVDGLDPRGALLLERAQLQLLRGEQVLRDPTERLAAERFAPSLTAPAKCGIWVRKCHSKVQHRAATPVVNAAPPPWPTRCLAGDSRWHPA
jgi:cold shock CspA family protein